jgi:hypothetical protein
MLTSILAAAALQATPFPKPEELLSPIALCVAALEAGAAPDVSEALSGWRRALLLVPGSDAAARDAEVAQQRELLGEIAAKASSDVSEVARGVVILAPNCLSAEDSATVAARLSQPAGGAQ